MYPQPALITALAFPDLVTLGPPLFRGTLESKTCVFALEDNAQIVTVLKATLCYEVMFLWISLSFGNEDQQLATSDEVVNFDDVKSD